LIRSYLRKEWCVTDAWSPYYGCDPIPGDGYSRELGADKEGGALAFQALQIANRMELMPSLEAARRDGTNLILVRYWQSAWVYGQLDGLDPAWLIDVHRSMVQAGVNILLDAPAEECMRRRAARDGALTPERYEGKLDFTRKVVELYRKLWTKLHPAEERWRIVDATHERGAEGVVDSILANLPSAGSPPCPIVQEVDPPYSDIDFERAKEKFEEKIRSPGCVCNYRGHCLWCQRHEALLQAGGLALECQRLREQTTHLQGANTEEVERRRAAEERLRQVRAHLREARTTSEILKAITESVNPSIDPWSAP